MSCLKEKNQVHIIDWDDGEFASMEWLISKIKTLLLTILYLKDMKKIKNVF